MPITPLTPEESVSTAFYQAWSACVGKPGYNKATWLAAEKQLFPGNFIAPVKPHFVCHNCGATAFAVRAFARGHLVSGVFSQEADEFKAKHKNCLPIQDGGCI